MEMVTWESAKTQETLGNYQNMVSCFRTIWSTMDPKQVKNGHFPQRLVFALLLGFATFSAEGPIPNAQKTLFYRTSYSKGPNHALEEVLTRETPSIFKKRVH